MKRLLKHIARRNDFHEVVCGLIILMGILSCSESEDSRQLAELDTRNVIEITINSAKSGGNITSDGGASVTARGVCWSTNPTPTIDDNITNDGSGGGAFVSLLTGLAPNTLHYIRAYATTANGTAYGTTYSFATEIITITTNAVIEVTGTTAKSGGKIIAISGLTIIETGVCWDVIPDPTTSKTKIPNEEAGEAFESVLTNLTPTTKYYVRAYAISDGFGTFYGDEKTFTTSVATQEEIQLGKLKGSWTIQSVSNDGVNRSSEYPNMSVAISGSFSVNGLYNYSSIVDSWPSASPWKALDTWKFKPGSAVILVRQSDLTEITSATSNSDNTLTLSFNYQGPGFSNGKVTTVAGDWIFVFTRP